MEELVTKIHDATFKRYISSVSTLRKEPWKEVEVHALRGVTLKIWIRRLLKKGYNVKGGYIGSVVRGRPKRSIFYKQGSSRGPR